MPAPLPQLGDTLDPKRVEEVAACLKPERFAFGRPAADRQAWQDLISLRNEAAPRSPEQMGMNHAMQNFMQEAEEGLEQEPAVVDDALFLEFSQTGNRTHWQDATNKRNHYLTPMVLAECLEYEGRFLPAIEKLIHTICDERTWVMPAHDTQLTNFHRTNVYIDLASSAEAWAFATIDYLLGDRLSAPLRRRIREEVQWRVFEPFREIQAGRREGNWWMTGTNNWNAVCLAGCVGAALGLIDDPAERAWYIVAGQEYARHFLAGFPPDGYCTEGVGYWNYGFGRYVLLAEEIYQATDAKIDLMDSEEVRRAALYGAQIEVQPGVSPAFADCSPKAQPADRIMYYVSRRYGLGLERWDRCDPRGDGAGIFEVMMYAFPNSASQREPAPPQSPHAARTWFPEGQVYIGRPELGAPTRLHVALKGGHNAEHHNHNDLGSYICVLDGATPVLDPGGEVYTRRTFSPERYVSNVLNSFGHSVPRVAGKLQEKGPEAAARVLSADYAVEADKLVFDLRAAYDVTGLKTLERAFLYDRRGAGALEVVDTVEFDEPAEFETAVVTASPWRKEAEGVYVFGEGPHGARVVIEAQGGEVTFEPEEIREDVHLDHLPVRMGIRFREPVQEATVTVRVEPLEA